MSRRIPFFVLAASAALIATQATADPECFGETCRLPEVVEAPAASLPSPDADESAAPETNAAVQKPAPAKMRPQVLATPQEESQPMARRPSPSGQSVAEEASVPREPARLAPHYLKDAPPAPARVTSAPPVMPADYGRSVRVSSPDPTYVLGYNAAPVAGVVVVVPGALYAGRSPVYMIAPSAKIISIDTDD